MDGEAYKLADDKSVPWAYTERLEPKARFTACFD